MRGGGDGGDEDDGLAAADGDGAVGELRELAGFDGDGSGADLARDVVDTHVLFLMPTPPLVRTPSRVYESRNLESLSARGDRLLAFSNS